MRDRRTGQMAVESFLVAAFPGWRVAAEPDGDVGVLFRVSDERSGGPGHVLGITDELLKAYATAEDLGRFLSSMSVRQTLDEHGAEVAWLSTTGWQ